VDAEIRRIVIENLEVTRAELKAHQPQLIALSEALLEKETLEGAEVRAIIFPGGVPDHLKPKAVADPFKEDGVADVAAEETDSAPVQPSVEPETATPTEETPEA